MILIGSDKIGKTTAIQELSKHHKRGVVNLNELKEWNIQHKTQPGLDVEKYLAEKALAWPEWEKKEAKIKKRDENQQRIYE